MNSKKKRKLIVILRFFSQILPGKRCDKCKKKFHKAEELMQHKQIIHGKDLPYHCKRCKISFGGMEQMRDHLRKFHSYKKSRPNKKTEEV